ncbi:replication endonuclease, partial [Roseateles violae]
MTYSAETLAWARAQADAPYYEAVRQGQAHDALRAAGERIDTATARIDGSEPDARLREVAQARADAIYALVRDYPRAITVAWLNKQLELLQARPFVCKPGHEADKLPGMVKRACCRLWWRRQLRRAAVLSRETAAMHAGEVCARRRQPYVTNDTLRRYELADRSNRAMLEATELESADGETINLLQAIEASTANKGIRRAELMTRIRGAEEWAEARGMVGLFTTNTAPSRFHPQHFKGGANHRHTGGESSPGAGNYGPVRPNTPKDAQAWLCTTWARARAALQRQGLRVFGYRVAEPHHDACPHWHMLLWCDPAQLDALRATIRAYWLADHPDEPGATEHRFKAKPLDKGGAVSYVAKYISKGIDDTGAIGAEGHTDERGGEQSDMFDGTANRVQRWAAAWGIRQFQAIGQPPVTVWRELRRVSELAAQGATPCVQAAHAAVSKTSGRRACWRAYMDAQGGAMMGRDYRVRVIDDGEPQEGRYGVEQRYRPVGVYDAARPSEWILSDRKQWKPRGTWAPAERVELRGPLLQERPIARPQAAQPWTRVINCTRRGGAAYLMNSGIAALSKGKESPGG